MMMMMMMMNDLYNVLNEYADVFSEIPITGASVEEMHINYKEGFEQPKCIGVRQYSPVVLDAMRAEIDNQFLQCY